MCLKERKISTYIPEMLTMLAKEFAGIDESLVSESNLVKESKKTYRSLVNFLCRPNPIQCGRRIGVHLQEPQGEMDRLRQIGNLSITEPTKTFKTMCQSHVRGKEKSGGKK